jgi:integrase
MTRPAGGQPSQPIAHQAPIPARAPTLGHYLARWLTEVVWPSLAPATCAYYETVARLYITPALGGIQLDRLQTRDVQAWLDRLAKACQCCAQGKDAARPEDRQRCCAIGACCHNLPGLRTVQAARDTLRAALNHARASDELVSRNVAAYARVPSPPRHRLTRSAWTADEATRFLASARDAADPLYAAYVLMLVNALRRGEVLGLTWPSADLDSEELIIAWQLQRVGKQLIHKKRPKPEGSDTHDTLPMPSICSAALRQHGERQAAARQRAGDRWQDSDLVFTTRWGTPIEPRNFNRSFDARCARAGIRRIPVYDTRHTCASLLAALNVHPQVAMLILRHAKIAMTSAADTRVPGEDHPSGAEKPGGLPLAQQDQP